MNYSWNVRASVSLFSKTYMVLLEKQLYAFNFGGLPLCQVLTCSQVRVQKLLKCYLGLHVLEITNLGLNHYLKNEHFVPCVHKARYNVVRDVQ